MTGEGGDDLWHGGVYREIIEPERMVFTFAWDGDDGKPENEMRITVTFAEEKGGTENDFSSDTFPIGRTT